MPRDFISPEVVGKRGNTVNLAKADAWEKAYRAAAAEKEAAASRAPPVVASMSHSQYEQLVPTFRTAAVSPAAVSDNGEAFLWGEVNLTQSKPFSGALSA